MKKIAFVITHPIQYYVPIFQRLAEDDTIEIKVFYTWGEDSLKKYDPDFKQVVEWDIPLLEGYNYEFCHNISKEKGSHHYKGIDAIDLQKKVAEFNPDLVCIYGWNYKSHLKLIRKLSGKVKLAFRGDSHLIDPSNLIKRFLRKIVLKYVYSYVDYFFYVGSKNKEYFLTFGVKEEQLFFINHAVDEIRFTKIDQIEVGKLHSKFNITTESKVILYAGKLETKKGVEDLLEAFNQLNNSRYILLIIGDGQNYDYLKSKYNASNIHFEGLINQKLIPTYYQISDLFVLPSRGPNETWGLVLNEAMSCGLAVIASKNVGASYDLIQPGKNGYVYDPANLTQLKEAIYDILEGPLVLFKKSSLVKIQDYSMTKCVERLKKSLEKIFDTI